MSGFQYMVVGHSDRGITVASRIRQLGHAVTLVGRKIGAATSSTFEGWSQYHTFKVRALSDVNVSSMDCVIFCVKAFDLKGAVERYISYIPKNTPIIIICKGAIHTAVTGLLRKYPDYVWRVGYYNFETLRLKEAIFRLERNGSIVFGNAQQQKSLQKPLTAAEQTLVAADSNFFVWQTPIQSELARRWFVELVVHSLSAAYGQTKIVKLLDDLKTLRSVAQEAYVLGAEVWAAPYALTFDKMFEMLVTQISNSGQSENYMARALRLGERTENGFYAKLAVGHRNMEGLQKLYEIIDQKEKEMREKKILGR